MIEGSESMECWESIRKKLDQLFIGDYLSSSLLEESDEESLFLSFLEDFSDLPDLVRLLLLTADLI